MSISDADYQKWLFGDNQRCVLVEAKAYSGATEITRYFANKAFVSSPSDSPSNTPYDDILISIPTFTSQLLELFTGRSIPSWGDLLLTNENGLRDSWLLDGWDGRNVKLYLGAPTWDKSDFRLMLDGVIADISSPQRDRISLKINDKSWMLNIPAQTNLMAGSTANLDQPQPLCFGQCFNVEPVLETAATHTYRVHDGAINDVTDVRDSGVSVAYTKDLANGRFTLNASPSGRITADVQGAKPGGTYLTKCADIVQSIITAHSQLTSSDIDASNFTAFNSTCPQTLGLYVRERQNLIDIIDQLVTSVGGWWTFSRAGLMQLGRLAATTGSAILSMTADDVREKQISIASRTLPVATFRLAYKKNYTLQESGLAGAVTEANRALYAAPYQVAKATDSALFTIFKLAQQPDVIDSLLAIQSEAATEATRRQSLYDAIRTTYSLAGYVAPYTLSLGNEILLMHPRFGFSSGVDAIVVGIVEEITRNRVTLTLWK